MKQETKCNYCKKPINLESNYVETTEFKEGTNFKSIFHHKECYETVMKGVTLARHKGMIDNVIDYITRRVKSNE